MGRRDWTPDPPDDGAFRVAALRQAAAWFPPGKTQEMLEGAERFLRFLQGTLPVRLVIRIGPVTEQDSQNIMATYYLPERHAMQITDTQKFSIHVDALDAKGVEVVDTFTASVADEGVCTLVTEDASDTWTVLAGLPGSTVITVTDGTLSATLAVDVVPSGVATIQIVAGEVTEQ